VFGGRHLVQIGHRVNVRQVQELVTSKITFVADQTLQVAILSIVDLLESILTVAEAVGHVESYRKNTFRMVGV
jgi:hypothetical protein